MLKACAMKMVVAWVGVRVRAGVRVGVRVGVTARVEGLRDGDGRRLRLVHARHCRVALEVAEHRHEHLDRLVHDDDHHRGDERQDAVHLG